MPIDRVSRGLLAALAAALVTACSSSVPIPDAAQLTCSGSGECPSGFLCHNGMCERIGALDTRAPNLTSVVVSPATSWDVTAGFGRAGTTFTIDLQADEPLLEPPTLTIGTVPPVVVTCAGAARGTVYRCTYQATGAENGSLGGIVKLDVWLEDLSRNETTRNRVATLALDFEAPAVAAASVAYYPDPSNPLPAVKRATAGTVVRVAVSADELLDPTAATSLSVNFGQGPVAFELVPGSLTATGAAFEALVPPSTQDGLYTPSVTWTDPAGNTTTTSVGLAPIAVKTSPPYLNVNQAKVVFVRSPWGNAAPEDLGGYTIPAGTYFALEPADPLSSDATLPAEAFALEDGSVPSAVLVKSSSDPGGLILGTLRPDASGGWPRQALSSPDLMTVFVVGLDDAGNPSIPVKVLNAEWVATHNPPPAGQNPHTLETIGYVTTTTQEQAVDVRPALPADAAGSAGQTIVARAEAAWREMTPTNVPVPRSNHAMAYDSARGRVVLFGGQNDRGQLMNDTWEWNGGSWTRVSTSGPSARSAHAMAFDSARGQVVLFGGGGSTGRMADTWAWNGISWTQVASTGPAARQLHAMAYDAARGQVVLFGGISATDSFAQDTWVWSGSSWTQKSVTAPPGRNSHAMAFDGARGQVVLFGGVAPGGAVQDTWVWDGSSWTRRSPSTSPAARSAHALAYDATRGQVVLFGGSTTSGSGQDTWTWDGTSWTQKPTPSSSPGIRWQHAMAYDSARGQVVLFGGSHTNDATWLWDGTSWAAAPTSPGSRGGHAMAYDAGRRRVVLFGGWATGAGAFQDTWEWDGSGWTKAMPPNPLPSARTGHAMAYDSARGRVLLFGGNDASGDLRDTWVWDGNTWTQLSPATSPPARRRHAMAFDAARGQVVLFGGEWSNGPYVWNSGSLYDTWVWDGSSWSSAPAVGTLPQARSGHAMAYDGARSEVVLFGGWDRQQYLNDTWVWNGSSWTVKLPPAPLPPVRADGVMAYDSAQLQVVLFGGSPSRSDTWVWNGITWADATPSSPNPAAGGRNGMAYDRARERLVVFQGVCTCDQSGACTCDQSALWEREASPTRQPAIQLDPSRAAAGIDPGAVTGLRVRAFAGGTFFAGTSLPANATAGASLLGWHCGTGASSCEWLELATNGTGAALQPPYLPPAPASLVSWSAPSPAEAQQLGSFQVRPSGAAGSDPNGARVAVDYIEVRVRYAVPAGVSSPSQLAYSSNPALYRAGQAITANVPSTQGGAAAVYWISPPLPAGLRLDSSTGIISGTPTVASPSTTYLVTAANAGGSTTSTLTIKIMDDVHVPPSQLVYSANPAIYGVGVTMTPNVPSSSGGAVVSYSASPDLPPGLSLDPSTGVISGEPTTLSSAASYLVTATNLGGSTTATLDITVIENVRLPPSQLVYSANPATYSVGTAITPNVPTSGGGAVLSYSVSPSLPAGLSLDPATGVISGVPSTISPATSYTVTATNLGGSTDATVSITVNCQPATFCDDGLVCLPWGQCDYCALNSDCPAPYICDFDGICRLP
jgi:hypothetical protein